jgi:hypothetical protein
MRLQTVLLLIFIAAGSIHLFNVLRDSAASNLASQVSSSAAGDLASQVLGFDSVDELVTVLITLHLALLSFFTSILVHQYFAHRNLSLLRLVSSNEPPELELANSMEFHLFLSHIWSSGQDQARSLSRSSHIPGS